MNDDREQYVINNDQWRRTLPIRIMSMYEESAPTGAALCFSIIICSPQYCSPSPGVKLDAFCSKQSDWHCPGAGWQSSCIRVILSCALSLSLFGSIPRTYAIMLLIVLLPMLFLLPAFLAVLDHSFSLTKERKTTRQIEKTLCWYIRRRGRLSTKNELQAI